MGAHSTSVESFLLTFISDDERLLEVIGDLSAEIGFVPYGLPTKDYDPGNTASLALTTKRLIIIFALAERVYSATGILGLSERFFCRWEDPRRKPWPYQAILVLPGGLNLVIQTYTRDEESGKRAAAFLSKALFTLGKRESDLAGLAAANDYQRRQEERNR
jgi:hypothetical protein